MKSTSEPSFSARPELSVRPEWKLILACARVRLDPVQRRRIAELLQESLDWPDVVATAMRHCVEPLLYRHLAKEFAGAVPPDTLKSLEEIAFAKGQRCLYMAGQMVELLDRFQKAGIRAIPYKGPTLAALAYGNFALRSSEDLDFVLPQQDVAEAFQMLVAAGFQSDLDSSAARGGRLLADGQIGQYCFFSKKDRLMVELHTEKTLRYVPGALDWEGLRQRFTTVVIGGREVTTFSLEDTLLLLSVHGAKHFWNRLSWVCDIAAIVQAPQEVNWELSEDLAHRMGCRRMWLLGLSLANEILDAPLPSQVLRRVRDDSKVAAMSRNVREQLSRRDEIHPGALQRFFFRLRSHETWAQGFRQLSRVATQPTEEDHQAYTLPEWAAPLYLFLRPWRLLREHGLGLHPRRAQNMAPFVPTPPEIVEQMLRLAGVQRGDVLYDLGCGDGRIVVAAAKSFGIRAVGVDIDPQRIAEARANARRNGVEHLVELRNEEAKAVNLSAATVVTLFLDIAGNLALVGKLRKELCPGARIVSRDYWIPGWPHDGSRRFELAPSRTTMLYLWHIPDDDLAVPREMSVSPVKGHA